jgi:DNA end-binding protein Ku
MAQRANWKGFLRLSLVTCPVALFPATSEAEKINFNQINKNTGNRIKYRKVDAETGDEVEADDIVKGYKTDGGNYIQVEPEEIEAIAPESSHTIEIDEFVPREEIDDLYLVRPYYIVPDGKAGHDAYAVIRETIRMMEQVALARIVLTNREHVMALEARGKGLVGLLLRYPYEVRDAEEYFDGIKDTKITKDMLDLAKHIVETKSGHFEPKKFEDHYENALAELLKRKSKGQKIEPAKPRESAQVIDLMEALRRSVKGGERPTARRAPARKSTATRRSSARKQKAG